MTGKPARGNQQTSQIKCNQITVVRKHTKLQRLTHISDVMPILNNE